MRGSVQVPDAGRSKVAGPLSPAPFPRDLARIAALIPPPRSPLIRFHGAFAGHYRKRKQVVAAGQQQEAVPSPPRAPVPHPEPPAKRPAASPATRLHHAAAKGTEAAKASPVGGRGAKGASQQERQFAGTPWRIDWATLLQRVYDVNALECPNCGGGLRFIELVTDRVEAKTWLERLGMEAEPPPLLTAGATERYLDLADAPGDWPDPVADDDEEPRPPSWDP